MKFATEGFFSKCGHIRRKLRAWSPLLKKSLMKNFIFCAESVWLVNPTKNGVGRLSKCIIETMKKEFRQKMN